MKKVLVVDDNSSFREMIVIFIKIDHPDAEITQAQNGIEGGDKFVEGDFDTVITDFEMPGRNGLELLRFIKNNAKRSIRAALVSGLIDSSLRANVEELGFIFLQKPFQLADFRLVIGE